MKENRARLPRVRDRRDLIVEEMADEVLVYDSRSQKAHCLNRSAALVWNHCDGRTTHSQMLKLLTAAKLASDEDVIQMALQQLASAGLLEPAANRRHRNVRISRRRILRGMAIAGGVALMLPLVDSVVAPTVAQAQSAACGNPGVSCCAPGTYAADPHGDTECAGNSHCLGTGKCS